MIDPCILLVARRTTVAIALMTTARFCSLPIALAQSIGSAQAPAPVAERTPDGLVAGSGVTRLDYETVSVAIGIDLPSVDLDSTGLGQSEPGIPLRVGVPIPIPDHRQGNLLADATWTTLAGGAQVTSLSLRSPRADRLRVALRATLPDGARVRFFALTQGEQPNYPVYSREDFERRGADRIDLDPNHTSGMLWSPIVDGDTLGMEIEIPASQRVHEASLQIVRTSHLIGEAAVRMRQR